MDGSEIPDESPTVPWAEADSKSALANEYPSPIKYIVIIVHMNKKSRYMSTNIPARASSEFISLGIKNWLLNLTDLTVFGESNILFICQRKPF